MLYKLSKTGDVFGAMEPMPFKTFADCGQVEKDLENLLVESPSDTLFIEDNELMPIFQQRPRQPEADIYALDEKGDLIIFELKRATASDDAVHQALRYCETAAQWDYNELQNKYLTWCDKKGKEANREEEAFLQSEHQSNFNLDTPLPKSAFNQQQRLRVVGSAGSDALVRNIEYWKSKGIAIDFIPYRIYEIGGEHYFEFFSHPYDRHHNPRDAKGVIFDTNLSYDAESIWYMCEKDRVAAFGGTKEIIRSLSKGDIVFLYHKGEGIIAAGEVRSDVKEDAIVDALYCDLQWLTSKPTKGMPYKFMPAWQIKQVMDRNFWWANTTKRPYLSKEDAEKLLDAIKTTLE